MATSVRAVKSRNIPVLDHATPEFAEPKRTRVPVPEHLKFFGYPEDFPKFYADLLPNLRAFAKSRLKQDSLVDEAIANFIVYMLDSDRHGTPRWKLYNNNAYQRQPYFKWLITQFGWVVLDAYNDNQKQIKLEKSQVAIINADDGEDLTPGTITLDRLFGPVVIDPTGAIMMDEVAAFVATLAKPVTVANKRSFEANVIPLYQLMLDGASVHEMSNELSVSNITVRDWRTKLCNLLRGLFPEQAEI